MNALGYVLELCSRIPCAPYPPVRQPALNPIHKCVAGHRYAVELCGRIPSAGDEDTGPAVIEQLVAAGASLTSIDRQGTSPLTQLFRR